MRDSGMAISQQDVEYVAKLARLEFSPAEKKHFAEELGEILAYMAKLSELDTSRVEPLTHVHEMANELREDVVLPSLPSEEILRNAPSTKETLFKVPNVLGKTT